MRAVVTSPLVRRTCWRVAVVRPNRCAASASSWNNRQPANKSSPAPRTRPQEAKAATALRARPQERSRHHQNYFVTCHPGLEEVVAAELRGAHIQASNVTTGSSGVYFSGTTDTGYRACLWLRAATRVLVVLAEGNLNPAGAGGDELYSFFRRAAEWDRLLRPRQTFSVKARVHSCTDVPSAMLVQVRARDAICDAIRDSRGTKPDPPERSDAADLPLFAALLRDRVTLYADLCGVSLHRRGYRSVMHRASLNEAAAAGVLALAGWTAETAGRRVLADPMCGSGTFLIEAALVATQSAPGLSRQRWPFQGWGDFDVKAWTQAQQQARSARRPWRGRLHGCDVHQGALSLAQRDAAAAGVAEHITWHTGLCENWRPADKPSLVICNPPWGQRLLGDESGAQPAAAPAFHGYQQTSSTPEVSPSLKEAWQSLSAFLKGQCPDSDAFILSGNKDLGYFLRMKASARTPLTIGGQDCRLLRYFVLAPKVASMVS